MHCFVVGTRRDLGGSRIGMYACMLLRMRNTFLRTRDQPTVAHSRVTVRP